MDSSSNHDYNDYSNYSQYQNTKSYNPKLTQTTPNTTANTNSDMLHQQVPQQPQFYLKPPEHNVPGMQQSYYPHPLPQPTLGTHDSLHSYGTSSASNTSLAHPHHQDYYQQSQQQQQQQFAQPQQHSPQSQLGAMSYNHIKNNNYVMGMYQTTSDTNPATNNHYTSLPTPTQSLVKTVPPSMYSYTTSNGPVTDSVKSVGSTPLVQASSEFATYQAQQQQQQQQVNGYQSYVKHPLYYPSTGAQSTANSTSENGVKLPSLPTMLDSQSTLVQHTNPYISSPTSFQPKRRYTIPDPTGKVSSVDLSATAAGVVKRNRRCSICNKVFNRPSGLKIHMHTHTGEKPFKCEWKDCGKMFSVRSNMIRHLKIHMRKQDQHEKKYLPPQL